MKNNTDVIGEQYRKISIIPPSSPYACDEPFIIIQTSFCCHDNDDTKLPYGWFKKMEIRVKIDVFKRVFFNIHG